MSRRQMSCFTLALATVSVFGLWAPAAAQESLPETETAENPDTVIFTRARPGPVYFPHLDHAERVPCVACHHEARADLEPEREYQPCGDCHTEAPEPPVMTPISEIFHVRRAASGLCVDCHRASEVIPDMEPPGGCRDCHVRR